MEGAAQARREAPREGGPAHGSWAPTAAPDVRVSDTPEVSASARSQLEGLLHGATSVACDLKSSLGAAASAMGLEVSRSYSGERRLNALNAVHSALKHFVARMRGLSSRRMQRYMRWFCWHASFSGAGADRARASSLLGILAVGRYRTTRRGLFAEPYAVDARLAARAAKKG